MSEIKEQAKKCGVLGCTGMVGQRFLTLLSRHPSFKVFKIGASSRSAGKPYEKACKWKLSEALDANISKLVVSECKPENFQGCDIIFSGLDSDVAGEIESSFRSAGFAVFSNAKNYRMDPSVPLVVPLVNADHIDSVANQKARYGGYIVTNANCSTTGLVLPLKALMDAFGVLKSISVVTLQAISGAGYPGVPSLDIIDNVVPFIDGEEEKIETETRKILGTFDGVQFLDAPGTNVSAHCNRVPVLDGHLSCISVSFETKSKPSIAEISRAFEKYVPLPCEMECYSAPSSSIRVLEGVDRPQPRLDRYAENGFAVTVGRVRKDTVFDVRFVALVHNTILGAAGSSILNAEIAERKGLL
ncbi:aspartate-semialdehyde dehydrogenase [Ascobolus immersus RN42]|uniref:Aspartate-semialdehyde dehydrogenase n=1 Tax=Ascobolus immersus RN42 TaxID=1160509 RepID=A0A3N4IJN2_ASCIM|nr:aspartate-semialdehyde dehydrogenase [Ascobolus immersus RN42]